MQNKMYRERGSGITISKLAWRSALHLSDAKNAELVPHGQFDEVMCPLQCHQAILGEVKNGHPYTFLNIGRASLHRSERVRNCTLR